MCMYLRAYENVSIKAFTHYTLCVVPEFAVAPSAAAMQLKRIYSLKMVSVSKDNERLRTNGYALTITL